MSDIKTYSMEFAVQAGKFCIQLKKESHEFIYANQLQKASSSVGANVREAQFAQSKKDFISKMSIALKEANESKYWLTLIQDTQEIDTSQLLQLSNTVIRMLVKIVSTSKQNIV